MWDTLAKLATHRSRTVILAALLGAIVAGALGAGVADRLQPYGADDPETESVRADNRLEDAGFHDLGLIALVRGVDLSSPQTKQRLTMPSVAEWSSAVPAMSGGRSSGAAAGIFGMIAATSSGNG